MSYWRKPLRPAMALLWVAVLAAASVAGEAEEPVFTGELVIGATLPLSGEFETYGQSAYYGAMTAVKRINDNGGVNGKKLVVQWRDNRSDDRRAVADVRELVREYRVPAVVGPLLSSAAMAVQPVSEELEIVVISPMATIDVLTHDLPWTFRACFTNTDQARALSRFQIEKFGAKTCGILYDSRYEFCVELADVFAHEFTALGGAVVGKEALFARGEKDYEGPVTKLAAEKPDFIFSASYALEATELVHAARDRDVPIRLCGPHTWDNELVFDASGRRLAGTSFTSVLFEREFSYRPFRLFFQAMEQAGMDNPDAEAALAYDAVHLLAEGFKRGETPEELREGLMAIRRLPLATGRVTISKRGDAIKPVIIRMVERIGDRMVPVYAERYDP